MAEDQYLTAHDALVCMLMELDGANTMRHRAADRIKSVRDSLATLLQHAEVDDDGDPMIAAEDLERVMSSLKDVTLTIAPLLDVIEVGKMYAEQAAEADGVDLDRPFDYAGWIESHAGPERSE